MKNSKNSAKFYLLIFGGVFLALAVVLFFFNRWAPLLLLASLVVQLPIILAITKSSFTAGYLDRAFERRQKYAEDGDAAAFFAAEDKEATSVGYKYWSRGAKTQNRLNRAQALAALARSDEAAALLAEVDETKLPPQDKARFESIVTAIQTPPEIQTPAPAPNAPPQPNASPTP